MRAEFGVELRRRRIAARLSLGELSAMVHYSKSHLSKIENGVKFPSVPLARQCDAVLHAEGALAALAPRRRLSAEACAGAPARDGNRPAPRALPYDGEQRPAIADVPTSAPTLAAHEAETLGEFRWMFDHMRRLGRYTSPTLLLPILTGPIEALRNLARAATGSRRTGILLLTARYAEYAGWMAQESGDDRAAVRWTDMAVRLAEAADDRDMMCYALVRQALISLYRHDAVGTIELSRQAQSHRSVRPRVLGLAAQREAQGHALAGDYGGCQRALERARELLAGTECDPAGLPVLGPSTIPDTTGLVNGWCLYDLGRPRQAADLLDRELARVPDSAGRAWARYAVRLSLALAAAGDVERSCHVAVEALATVAAVDSATIRADVRGLARTLTRWSTHPAVGAVSPQLSVVLRLPDFRL
ncbi:helix-turn-helix domain-containing protein [Nonomuraea typhae]|uniref:helix-turn-helix domain-containing protein n=1 Tax=Nonomuraea typhae TaxID=2603600 RepID=UPI0012FC5207|nr:helix-turn-helix transcriptional regulator [Nonomuraea typhae]